MCLILLLFCFDRIIHILILVFSFAHHAMHTPTFLLLFPKENLFHIYGNHWTILFLFSLYSSSTHRPYFIQHIIHHIIQYTIYIFISSNRVPKINSRPNNLIRGQNLVFRAYQHVMYQFHIFKISLEIIVIWQL